jgi:hypothetical protein
MASGDLICAFAVRNLLHASAGGTYNQASNLVGSNGHVVLGMNGNFTNPLDARGWFGIIDRLYGGGTIDVHLKWVTGSTNTGNVVWEATLENLASQDLDADGLGTFVTGTTAAGGVLSQVRNTTISLDTAGKRDSVAAGDPFRLVVKRLGADGGDTYPDSVGLLRVELVEA